MISKIRYFLKDDKEREKIANAGMRRVLKEHTWAHRALRITQALNGTVPLEA